MKKTTDEKELFCGRFVFYWLLGCIVAIISAACALFGALHSNLVMAAVSFVAGMAGLVWSNAIVLELAARGYLQKDERDG